MKNLLKTFLVLVLVVSTTDAFAARKKSGGAKPKPATTKKTPSKAQGGKNTAASTTSNSKPLLPPKAQEAKDCTTLLTASVAAASSFWAGMVKAFMGGDDPLLQSLPTEAARKAARAKTTSSLSTNSGPKSTSKPPSAAELAKAHSDALETLAKFEKENPRGAQLAREVAYVDWLSKASKTSMRWSVSLLLDSPGAELSEGKKSEIINIVEGYLKNNWLIVYDGESTSASFISEMVGDRGIAIVSSPSLSNTIKGAPTLVIANPFVRLGAFSVADRTVVAAGSANGLGVLIRGKADKLYEFDESSDGTYLSTQWEPGFKEPNLGFNLKFVTKVKKSDVRLIESRGASTSIYADAKDPKKILKEASTLSIKSGIAIAQGLVDGVAALPKQDGAAVFGSGKYPEEYTEVVYSAVRALAEQGIAVTTGGSGGVMEIANAAAWDAGALSIGIPMGSGFKLETELDTPEALHSSTFYASGYEVRIPLLLNSKSLVVIAPGGGGTIKEIAAWLVKMSSTSADKNRALVFLGSPYYDGFVKGISGFLPERIKDSVFAVKDAEEMKELIELLKTEFWTPDQVASLTKSAPVEPRTDHQQFFVDGYTGGVRKKFVPPSPSTSSEPIRGWDFF